MDMLGDQILANAAFTRERTLPSDAATRDAVAISATICGLATMKDLELVDASSMERSTSADMVVTSGLFEWLRWHESAAWKALRKIASAWRSMICGQNFGMSSTDESICRP
jgi:hypothetical protein